MRETRFGIVLICCLAVLVGIRPNAPQPAAAQGTQTCSGLAQDAVTAAKQACGTAAVDSLCLGYDAVQAVTTGTANATFKARGDRISLAGVTTIASSAANPDAGNWGVAVLNIQAGLPADSKGITAILFGDATLAANAGAESANLPTLPVAATNRDVFLRGGAAESYPSTLKLPAGQNAVVDGRTKAADWLRVRINMAVGWAYAAQLKVDGDIQTLRVLDSQDTHAEFLYKAPMQSFILSTGMSGSKVLCTGDAPSGLLLQLADKQTAQFLVNGADVAFSASTLFLRATPKDRLDIVAVTGQATVTAMGSSITINAGEWTRLRLAGKDGLVVTNGPTSKTAYPFAVIDGAPVALLATTAPCTVGLPANGKATVRVGPGKERGSLFFMDANASYKVVGWANDSTNAPWWKIDSPQNKQAWVDKASVHSLGACEQIEQAAPPPVIVAAPPPSDSGDTGQSAGSTGDTGGPGFAPTARSFWNVNPGLDQLVGTCSGVAPINYCPSTVLLTPQGNGISYKGQELNPYYLYRVRENVYAYAGPAPEALGPGTIKLTLVFTSPTAWSITRVLTLASAPACQHVYTYTGTFSR